MPEIRPQEIASFWKFPILDIPIDKLSLYIKRDVSEKGEKKDWEVVDDPGVLEMLRFPMTEEDILNVLGPGEYMLALKYQREDGRPAFYGNGVYVKVGIQEDVPPEVAASTPSPEIEMLMATLAEHKETLASQKAMVDVLMQTIGKLVDAQKSTDSQFKDQMLMKFIEKMGSNQVDVAGIYAKALDTSALLESKRFDVISENKKEETELKRQESKQNHEINLIKLQQRLEAGETGLSELKNDGSTEDEIKKTNVVQDIVDAITKIGPVIDNFGEFVAKVKPTLISIKDIIGIAQGTPLAPEETETGEEEPEEPGDVLEEDIEEPAEQPAQGEDHVPTNDEPAETFGPGKGDAYDPNDPRKQ